MNAHLTETAKHGMFVVSTLLCVSILGDHFWNIGS